MRLLTAFLANRAEVVDGMLNLERAFWASTTVAANATGFRCAAVVLCDVAAEDISQPMSLIVDGEGPTGRRLPAYVSEFTLDTSMLFMCIPSLTLPIEPGGGFHVYRFRIDGQHERVDVRLAVREALS